jgi:two-component system, cell cycle sensor histidine kinase and response regulator CckA
MSETPTILVVDDEETVRAFMRKILMMRGYQVLDAHDGIDALEQITRLGIAVDLLLTDVRMPRMDGAELAQRLHALYPQTPILYISGYPFDLDTERRKYPTRICAFLSKPFTPKVLLEAVTGCLSSGARTSCA